MTAAQPGRSSGVSEQAAAESDDGLRAAMLFVAREALEQAADEVKRIREHGLRPGETYGPYHESIEKWLRKRAAALLATTTEADQ